MPYRWYGLNFKSQFQSYELNKFIELHGEYLKCTIPDWNQVPADKVLICVTTRGWWIDQSVIVYTAEVLRAYIETLKDRRRRWYLLDRQLAIENSDWKGTTIF